MRASGYEGDPIPYRLLNNCYTNQVANAQVLMESWGVAGLNVEVSMKENWSQTFERTVEPKAGRGLRDWSNSATFNDPVSSLVSQRGPNGEQQQYGECANEELNRLCVDMATSTDRGQQTFQWKVAPSFAMDFRAGNWGVRA